MNYPEIFKEIIERYKHDDQESIQILGKMLALPDIFKTAMEIISSIESDKFERLISLQVIKEQITHVGYDLNIEEIKTQLLNILLFCYQNNQDTLIIENLLCILSDIQIIYFDDYLIIDENTFDNLFLIKFLKNVLNEFQRDFVGAFLEFNKIEQKKKFILYKSINLLTKTNLCDEWLDFFGIVYESNNNKIDMFVFSNIFKEIIKNNLNDKVIFIAYEMILDILSNLLDVTEYLYNSPFDNMKQNSILLELITNSVSLSYIISEYLLSDVEQNSYYIYTIWDHFNEEIFELIIDLIDDNTFFESFFFKFDFVIDSIQFKSAYALISKYSDLFYMCYEYISPEALSFNFNFIINFIIKNHENCFGCVISNAIESFLQINENLFLECLLKYDILKEGLNVLSYFTISQIRTRYNIGLLISKTINLLIEQFQNNNFSQKGFLLISQNVQKLENIDSLVILFKSLSKQSLESSCILNGCVKLIKSNSITELIQNDEKIKSMFLCITQDIMKISKTFSSLSPITIEFLGNLVLKPYLCDEEKINICDFILNYFSELSNQILINIKNCNYLDVGNNVKILYSSFQYFNHFFFQCSKPQNQSTDFLLTLKMKIGNEILTQLKELFSLYSNYDIQLLLCDIIVELIECDLICNNTYNELQSWIIKVFLYEPFKCHFNVLTSIFKKKKLFIYRLSFNTNNYDILRFALEHLNSIIDNNECFIPLIQNGFNIWDYILTIDFIDKCLSSDDALLQSSCLELLIGIFIKNKILKCFQIEQKKELIILIFLIRGLIINFSQELFYKIQDNYFANDFIELLITLQNHCIEHTKLFFIELGKMDTIQFFVPYIKHLFINKNEDNLLKILQFLSFKKKFLLDIEKKNLIIQFFENIIFSIEAS